MMNPIRQSSADRRRCQNCGETLWVQDRFCPNCGTPTGLDEQAPTDGSEQHAGDTQAQKSLKSKRWGRSKSDQS
jgi:hypothetical protein